MKDGSATLREVLSHHIYWNYGLIFPSAFQQFIAFLLSL